MAVMKCAKLSIITRYESDLALMKCAKLSIITRYESDLAVMKCADIANMVCSEDLPVMVFRRVEISSYDLSSTRNSAL